MFTKGTRAEETQLCRRLTAQQSMPKQFRKLTHRSTLPNFRKFWKLTAEPAVATEHFWRSTAEPAAATKQFWKPAVMKLVELQTTALVSTGSVATFSSFKNTRNCFQF